MNWILSKILTGTIYILHPKLPAPYRWFVREGLIKKINQVQYFAKDYILKKAYKTMDFDGEFQQELLYVIPFAYWHYKNGTLLKSIGCKYTNELYYFSPKHEELYERRNYLNNDSVEIPNASHNIKINKCKWQAPPFKEVYKNNSFSFSKPVLIIANRYNSEWGNNPISFFSLQDLDILFNLLKKDYQIIYNRPSEGDIINDNSSIHELNDFEWITDNHKEILLLERLKSQNGLTANNYNHLQLQVYANSSKFISVHGGTATLASYFGGQNIILSKKGIEHEMNEFTNVFPELSGCKIYHAKTIDEIINQVKAHYL